MDKYNENFKALVKEITGDLDGVNTSDPEFLAAMEDLIGYYKLNKNKIKQNNKTIKNNKKNNKNKKTRRITFSNNVKVKPIQRMGPTQVVGEHIMEAPLPNNYPNRPKSLSSKTRRKNINQTKLFNRKRSSNAAITAAEMANAFTQRNTIYEVGNLIHKYRNNNDPLTKMFTRKYGPRMQNFEDYTKYYQSGKYLNYKPNNNENLYK
jgi:hypothetical protein